MSVFRKVVDRLADLLRHDRRITYRAFIDAHVAPHVTSLLDRIVADDEDGETLRCTLIPWQRTERPPIAFYRGDLSTCRIDGPWQVVGDHWFPLGGLILSPGVTAHLNPFEAQALHKHMEKAIEDAIVAWVRDHDLYSLRHAPEEIDRKPADRAAKAMIAARVAGQQETGTAPGGGIDRPDDCCSGEAASALCEACRKGSDHA
jgi:hypothetical protein